MFLGFYAMDVTVRSLNYLFICTHYMHMVVNCLEVIVHSNLIQFEHLMAEDICDRLYENVHSSHLVVIRETPV